MVQVKEVVTEQAITAKRRATEAEQKQEELELELECPICNELGNQSCASIPCGHVFAMINAKNLTLEGLAKDNQSWIISSTS